MCEWVLAASDDADDACRVSCSRFPLHQPRTPRGLLAHRASSGLSRTRYPDPAAIPRPCRAIGDLWCCPAIAIMGFAVLAGVPHRRRSVTGHTGMVYRWGNRAIAQFLATPLALSIAQFSHSHSHWHCQSRSHRHWHCHCALDSSTSLEGQAQCQRRPQHNGTFPPFLPSFLRAAWLACCVARVRGSTKHAWGVPSMACGYEHFDRWTVSSFLAIYS